MKLGIYPSVTMKYSSRSFSSLAGKIG